jgi:VIT1/CCC1 family predicted Fe2+/Mn2+ transporter/rubrerythrin
MMPTEKQTQFIQYLQKAVRKEYASQRIYQDLASREKNNSRQQVLMNLAKTESGHAQRWINRLQEFGAEIPSNQENLKERIWRWVLVQSGLDNALKRIESNEEDDSSMYAEMVNLATSEEDKESIRSVLQDEKTHRAAMNKFNSMETVPQSENPQTRLDAILHRESWHKHGGGWIGQAIYGANDGLGSVFGIVTGVAGATAGGSAVLISGLAGMLASALSMGSGAYLATKTEREMQEAEIRREKQEILDHPEEEEEELALFYQLKGVPEEEAKTLAKHLISLPETALRTLGQEELGISEESYPNPWLAAISATLSTAAGAFIPIIPFFFTKGSTAILISFTISTLAHFLIGASKTVVTGLSPWKSGTEMTVIGLGEALITYGLGLFFGPMIN